MIKIIFKQYSDNLIKKFDEQAYECIRLFRSYEKEANKSELNKSEMENKENENKTNEKYKENESKEEEKENENKAESKDKENKTKDKSSQQFVRNCIIDVKIAVNNVYNKQFNFQKYHQVTKK